MKEDIKGNREKAGMWDLDKFKGNISFDLLCACCIFTALCKVPRLSSLLVFKMWTVNNCFIRTTLPKEQQIHN